MENNVIKRCRELFHRATPMGCINCGKFCDAACCNGDENACVFLFPGEKELIADKGFLIKETQANYGYDALVCDSVCERKYRPLGCMIFPLFPYALELGSGRVKIIPVIDPRANGVCPLCNNEKVIAPAFVRAVKRAGDYMLEDEQTREYLLNVSRELRELAELRKKFEEN